MRNHAQKSTILVVTLVLVLAGSAQADIVTLSLSDFVIFSGAGGGYASDDTIIGGHTVINGNIGSNQDLFLQGNPILPSYPAQLNGSAYAGGDLFFGQDLTVGSSTELREVVANGDAFISGGTIGTPPQTWIDGATIYGSLDALTATVNGTVTGTTTTGGSANTFGLISMPAATVFTAGGTDLSYNAATVSISPGTHGTLALSGDNNITLSSGNYYFDAITTSAGSNNKFYIDLKTLPGSPINIYSLGEVDFDTQDNMLYVMGPGDSDYALISDRPDLAALIYWETHDTFSLGGSGIWGGTVYSTKIGTGPNDWGIDMNQYINFTGAAYALDMFRVQDHGTWNYVQLVPTPSAVLLAIIGLGLTGKRLKKKKLS